MRMFAGIALPDAVRDRCATVAERLRSAGLDARYENPAKFHLTLAFLGNVLDARVPEVERALSTVASRMPPFALALDRIGAFPSERRPRIIWIGCRAQNPLYRRLAETMRAAYRELGFTFDDDAIAHVTIARVKGGLHRPVPMLDLSPIHVAVDQVALFESLPDEGTTRYVVRHAAALGAPAQS